LNFRGRLIDVNKMAKKKFVLEYEFKSSPKVLFGFLSTPNGLAEWFADDVNFADGIYTFHWDREIAKAVLVSQKENKWVRFRWVEDENADYFFELEILQDELTGDIALSVTDFALPEDKKEKELIWNNQIDNLSHVLGA
jgi:uncharacterized protein YndB with AHSA1/START domain